MLVKNRIKKHSEFQNVIEKGSLFRSQSFTFYVMNNKFGYTRIGISVPKKSGTAVIRNRIKRQIRAVFAEYNNYSKSLDLVIIVKRGFNVDNFVKTKEEIVYFMEKVGCTSEEKK